MQVVRKALLVLLVALLPIFLIGAAINYGLARVFGQPETVKTVIDRSDLYNSFTKDLLSVQEKADQKPDTGELPLNHPIVQQAFKNTFSASYLENTAEKVIDNLYLWLEGDKPAPDFVIDVTPVQAKFAAEISAGIKQRLAKLPACKTQPRVEFSAFDATCLPKGVTPSSAAAQIGKDITKGEAFLEDTVIEAAEIKGQGSNQQLFADQLKDVPSAYQGFKTLPIVLTALSLLMAVGIILLSASEARGLRRVGVPLIIAAVFIGLFAMLLDVGSQFAKDSLKNVGLENSIGNLATTLVKEVDKSFFVVAVVFLLLGVGLIVSSFFWQRRLAKNNETTGSSKPAEPDEHRPAKKPSDKIADS